MSREARGFAIRAIRRRFAMRHLYADFIDRVAKPMRYLGGEYQARRQGLGRRRRARRASRSPMSTTSGCAISAPRSSTRSSTSDPRIAVRARVRAVDRHGGASCARATCRSCRSRAQRPLREFDVVGFSLQYELTFTNVLTLLDLGGIPLRAADRGEDATARARRRPDGDAPRAARAVHRRGVHRRGRGAAARGRARVGGDAREIAPARARARDALAELARAFPVYVPSLYATEIDDATGMIVVGAPLDPRVPARGQPRDGRGPRRVSVPDATRRCRTPRPCSIARRSRSRAAAPRAAASARPA